MEVDYINGVKPAGKMAGVLRYQDEIHRRLDEVELNPIEYDPLPRILGNGIRVIYPGFQGHPTATSPISGELSSVSNKVFNAVISIAEGVTIIDKYLRYPYLVSRRVKKGNIKHITFQGFAYLLKLLKLKRTIVTCYDITPWVYENNRSLHWRLNMAGIRKAERIITISDFSKREIANYAGYPEDRIQVIHCCVNHYHFYPKRDKGILNQYNIVAPVILYVGSEHPRQNLARLIKAFAELKKELPEVKLVKVGDPQWSGAREELLKLIWELGLKNEVIFTGHVSEEDLPRWYNAADLFVYPCLYTGWSLPALEAMACGVPVVTSASSALPEVVGDAGITVTPLDMDGFARAMVSVLTSKGLREKMVQSGLERAKLFTWERAAEETLRVYREVASGD